MTSPNTRGFAAWINAQPPGPRKLIVTGEVETTNGALKPVLTKREPQGINGSILLLVLTIVDTGQVGTADIDYRDVRYEQTDHIGPITRVDIIWDNDIIESLPVSTAS